MRLAALIAATCLAAAPLAAEGTLTVSGRGAVFAAPDEARVTLGVTTEADAADAAMRANSEAMAAVMARLGALGIAARDLQTSSLSLSPRWEAYRSGEGTPQITGFVASSMLTVEVRDLDALGGVLDAALGSGANTLGGIAFRVADDTALRDEARRLAVADASAKAQVLAEAAGQRLGAISEIVEGGGVGGPVAFARMDMAMAESVPVAPGEIDLSETVRITWSLEE